MQSVSKLCLISLPLFILLIGCFQNTQNPNDIVKQVAKVYGEENPQIVSIKSTKTDNDQSPMYLIDLKGNFHKGNLSANDLIFSALGNRNYIWDIRAYNDKKVIWKDDELPK